MTATMTTKAPAAPTRAPAGRPSVAERYGLTEDDLDRLAEELDAIRAEVVADLGQEDVDYIRQVIRAQRLLEVAGRGLLFAGWFPPAWLGGTAALTLSKILDNMEIGHNVMHGQYDWTRDPELASADFEWDTACPSDQWRHSHNYMHHTFTNVVGKDKDVGYGILRMSDDQRWTKAAAFNPVIAATLAFLFQYGVMLHDLDLDRLKRRDLDDQTRAQLREIADKLARQTFKDYVLFPVLSGPGAALTLAGNAAASLGRNLWAFAIIFCGHFPGDVEQFTLEEAEGESRGHWYLRQLLGSANIDGGPVLHVLSGNLSFQIEHHLYPDLPARRYAEIAPRVREVCERYGLPYNSGGLAQQLTSVARRIVRLARR
jgi:NADPH-dependent stearoyl-CoA 9-desaturase